jgi:hypothetical protein
MGLGIEHKKFMIEEAIRRNGDVFFDLTGIPSLSKIIEESYDKILFFALTASPDKYKEIFAVHPKKSKSALELFTKTRLLGALDYRYILDIVDYILIKNEQKLEITIKDLQLGIGAIAYCCGAYEVSRDEAIVMINLLLSIYSDIKEEIIFCLFEKACTYFLSIEYLMKNKLFINEEILMRVLSHCIRSNDNELKNAIKFILPTLRLNQQGVFTLTNDMIRQRPKSIMYSRFFTMYLSNLNMENTESNVNEILRLGEYIEACYLGDFIRVPLIKDSVEKNVWYLCRLFSHLCSNELLGIQNLTMAINEITISKENMMHFLKFCIRNEIKHVRNNISKFSKKLLNSREIQEILKYMLPGAHHSKIKSSGKRLREDHFINVYKKYKFF